MYHGWIEQGDGKLAYGIPVVNGRLKGAMKVALRNIIERYELPVRLTANQVRVVAGFEGSCFCEALFLLQPPILCGSCASDASVLAWC